MRRELETADWTYGFGKLEVLLQQAVPSCKFTVFVRAAVKTKSKVVHFFKPAGRNTSPESTACPF